MKLLMLMLVAVLTSFTPKEPETSDATKEQSGFYRNPVIAATAPDPSVIRTAEGTFYLYHTAGNYPIYRSENMLDWQKVGEVFTEETYPKLIRNDRKAKLWAPEIRYIKGKYVVFYTLWFGNVWLSAIGYAVADTPVGPFVDKGIIIDSKPINVEQSIDQFYYEDNGKSYLFWGSFRNIYAIELDITDDVDISIRPETMVQVAGNAFEGSNIWKRGDWYYFFASVGKFSGGANSTYRTVVARSKNLLGPYVDRKGRSIMDNGYELILDRSDNFAGPGHNAGLVEDDAGNTWMYYHAYQLSNLDLARQLMLDRVFWDDDGWPYIKKGVPSDKARVPVVKKKEAPQRLRDYGVEYGIFKTGENNAITDVPGVKVGHTTIIEGENVRTGVTAIIPHGGNIFQNKVPAAVYVGNGFGKLAGATQIMELGNIETPIVLTNTLSVAAGLDALIDYTLAQKGNERVKSVNGVVGETNDGRLNDIRGRHVKKGHVLQAIANAAGGPVQEGNVGAGTGTVCFGFKGGIGTSSRVLPTAYGSYKVGVLVQSNYGGVLEIAGVPVGQLLKKYSFKDAVLQDVDGSCMMVIATDAPLDSRNLERLAKRVMMGLAKTGGIASNGSGDYVLAFSTYEGNLISAKTPFYTPTLLHNDDMSPLFNAAIEATAEALWNSLFAAQTMTGAGGRTVEELPEKEVAAYLKKALSTFVP